MLKSAAPPVNTAFMVDEAISFGNITIPVRGKIPTIKNWQNRSFDNCKEGFQSGDNVGILTGQVTNLLVLDLDSPVQKKLNINETPTEKDYETDGLEAWKRWLESNPEPETPCVRTGSGGFHYYFKYQHGFKSTSKIASENNVKLSIDIKTSGGYVVYPGSRHPDKGCGMYEWVKHPRDYPLTDIPQWLLDKLLPPKPQDPKPIIEVSSNAPLFTSPNLITSPVNPEEKSADGTIILTITPPESLQWRKNFKESKFTLFEKKVPVLKDIYELTEDWKEGLIPLKRRKPADCPICQREHDNDNAFITFSDTGSEDVRFYCHRDTTSSILLERRAPERSDLYVKLMNEHRGPAELIMEKYPQDLEVMGPKGPVYIYDESIKLWREFLVEEFAVMLPDWLDLIIKEIEDEIKETKKNLVEEYKRQQGANAEFFSNRNQELDKAFVFLQKRRKAFANFSVITQIAKWICNTKARSFDGVPFDDSKGLLSVSGGQVIDLKTGETTERTREHRFTKEIAIKYNKNAKSKIFDKFIAEIMLEDEMEESQKVKIPFLKRLTGYSLTGECSEQIMPVLIGEDGSNGKSTFTKLLLKTLPSLVMSGKKSIILKRKDDGGANSELHMLRGSRLVFMSEFNDREVIDEDIFKRMTGGDDVHSRKNYGDVTVWRPGFVCWVITNESPKYNAKPPILRRILYIKFNARFCEDPKLPHERKIDKSFEDNWSDISVQEAFLAWAVQGAMEWYKKKDLKTPQVILNDNESYRLALDPVKLFLDEDVIYLPNPEEDTIGVSAQRLYAAFEKRCRSEGYGSGGLSIMKSTEFGKAMSRELTSRNIRKKKRSIMYYLGIRLEEPQDNF